MPRNSSTGVYARPVGTDAVPDTTIESTKYNNNVADVEQDLNAPRPIVAGGTGASDAATAMSNLGGELARQVITNYDSAPFQAGSFYSAAGATSAPSANAFTGICYSSSATNTDLFIEARDQTTSTLYVRQKIAGVWQGWSVPAGVSAGPAPPSSTLPNSLWWDSTRGKLFIYYKDVNSSQWVEAVAVPDIDANTFVEIAGDVMTGPLGLYGNAVSALQAVPKQQLDAVSVAAAPLDALAYSGMQINGSMEVSQELGTVGVALVSGVSKYALDGFNCVLVGASVTATASQIAIASLASFPYALNFQCTAVASLAGAGDVQAAIHPIEGYRWARMAFGNAAAQSVTIGFWIYPNVTGNLAVSLRNAPTINRSYVADVPVTAGVWQYKTVTIPGDVVGTWVTNNNVGANISFCFGAGSNFRTAANAWTAGNFIATPATSNLFSAIGANLITGVVVLPGIQVPTAARSPLIMRPYDQELLTCKRYYSKMVAGFRYSFVSGGSASGEYHLMWPVEMRAIPTIAFGTPAGIGNMVSGYPRILNSVTAIGGRYELSAAAFGDAFCLAHPITLDARL
jgi:hypothetical protein